MYVCMYVYIKPHLKVFQTSNGFNSQPVIARFIFIKSLEKKLSS